MDKNTPLWSYGLKCPLWLWLLTCASTFQRWERRDTKCQQDSFAKEMGGGNQDELCGSLVIASPSARHSPSSPWIWGVPHTLQQLPTETLTGGTSHLCKGKNLQKRKPVLSKGMDDLEVQFKYILKYILSNVVRLLLKDASICFWRQDMKL